MAGDNHGDKTKEEPRAQEDFGQQQAMQEQPQVRGTDWGKVVTERDEKIVALEAQVAEAAKKAETTEQLRSQIAEPKAQGESDRIDFKLQLAVVRNAKEVLIPKVSVTGLGDYTRNVGYKTGSITYEYEAHSFGFDQAIRLFANVMDVEESGMLDCFVEAGAELQSTALLLHGLAHASVDVCTHVCRQRREVAPVATLCRNLLWDVLLHWRVLPG